MGRPIHMYAASALFALATVLLVVLAPHAYLMGVLVGVLASVSVALVVLGLFQARLEGQAADLQEQMSAILDGGNGDLSSILGGLGGLTGMGPLGGQDAAPKTAPAPVTASDARRVLAAEDRPIHRTAKPKEQ